VAGLQWWPLADADAAGIKQGERSLACRPSTLENGQGPAIRFVARGWGREFFQPLNRLQALEQPAGEVSAPQRFWMR